MPNTDEAMYDHDLMLKHLRKLLKRKGLTQSNISGIIKGTANAVRGGFVEYDDYAEGMNWLLDKVHTWPIRAKDLMTPCSEWEWHFHHGPKGRGWELHLNFIDGDTYIIQKTDWWNKKDNY